MSFLSAQAAELSIETRYTPVEEVRDDIEVKGGVQELDGFDRDLPIHTEETNRCFRTSILCDAVSRQAAGVKVAIVVSLAIFGIIRMDEGMMIYKVPELKGEL